MERILIAIGKVLLINFIEGWWAARKQRKQTENAIAPYKAEADALAAPDSSKSDNVERLRGLHRD